MRLMTRALILVCFVIAGVATAESRTIYSVFAPSSYYYVSIANPSSSSQTVSVTYKSTGFKLLKGGFPGAYFSLVFGLPNVAGNGVAGDAVTCTNDASGTSTTCTASATLASGGILRVGAKADGSACPAGTLPYGIRESGACVGITTSSTSGVLLTVTATDTATGSPGFVIGNTYLYTDISDASIQTDTATSVALNGGRPF